MAEKNGYRRFCLAPTSGRQEVYRLVTGLQIAFSCLSLTTLCIVLPIMYNHVQTTIEYVDSEMRYCEVLIEIFLRVSIRNSVKDSFNANKSLYRIVHSSRCDRAVRNTSTNHEL